MKLLIISNKNCIDRDSIDFTKFINQNSSNPIFVTTVCAEELYFEIRPNMRKTKICTAEDIDIAHFDLVYIKRADSTPELAVSIAIYLKNKKIKFITSDLISDQNISSNKIIDHMLFSRMSLNAPPTIVVSKSNIALVSRFFPEDLVFPLICKSVKGSKGSENYLFDSFKQIEDLINQTNNYFLVQKFIPNDFDYRVLVFGFKTRLVIKRTRTSGQTHLNNIHHGAKAEIVSLKDVNKKIIDLSEHAAKLLKREVAGVDIIETGTGEVIILEVNRPPEIESGSFIYEKCNAFAEYIMETRKGTK